MLLEKQAQVVFRLPSSNQVEAFASGNGPDKFLIAPFLKNKALHDLNGNIYPINTVEIKAILDDFKLIKSPLKGSISKDGYIEIVSKAIRAIEQNNFEKVVIAGTNNISFSGDLFTLFDALIQNYPDAFVYCFILDGICMIGATPERLLVKEGVLLKTEALGGTRTRGVFTEKELQEHKQIQTYISDILVDNSFKFRIEDTKIKQAGKLEHLCTEFDIDSKSNDSDLNLALYLHPTSAVCGLPYDRALEFILQNEEFERGYYSGFLGPVRSNGDFDLYVNLRCAKCYSDTLDLYAGAGITIQSNPTDEWIEISNKMQTIARWVK